MTQWRLMEKNGLNTDILSEREERFDHVLSIFETVAENEERTEFNDALREMAEPDRKSVV